MTLHKQIDQIVSSMSREDKLQVMSSLNDGYLTDLIVEYVHVMKIATTPEVVKYIGSRASNRVVRSALHYLNKQKRIQRIGRGVFAVPQPEHTPEQKFWLSLPAETQRVLQLLPVREQGILSCDFLANIGYVGPTRFRRMTAVWQSLGDWRDSFMVCKRIGDSRYYIRGPAMQRLFP